MTEPLATDGLHIKHALSPPQNGGKDGTSPEESLTWLKLGDIKRPAGPTARNNNLANPGNTATPHPRGQAKQSSEGQLQKKTVAD